MFARDPAYDNQTQQNEQPLSLALAKLNFEADDWHQQVEKIIKQDTQNIIPQWLREKLLNARKESLARNISVLNYFQDKEKSIEIEGGSLIAKMVAVQLLPLPFGLLLSLLFVPQFRMAVRRGQKAVQMLDASFSLLFNFCDRNIHLIPEIKTEHGTLDLLMRFPEERINFAIALRSQSGAEVAYREEDDVLVIRRKKGTNRWKPDHVQQLADQEFWIRKFQRDLLGKTAREVRRSIVKVLVLTGDTRLGKHPDHLYAAVGDQKFLMLKKRASVYVVEEEDLNKFIEAWLTQSAQEPQNSQN